MSIALHGYVGTHFKVARSIPLVVSGAKPMPRRYLLAHRSAATYNTFIRSMRSNEADARGTGGRHWQKRWRQGADEKDERQASL